MPKSDTGDIEGRLARLEQQDQRLTRALELLAQREAAPVAKPGRGWDAYAAVIASFIGLLALAVSGYTAYVQRQQLRAQVWPHLHVGSSDAPGIDPRYVITNAGTGPARVTAVRVLVDGAPARTRMDISKAVGFANMDGLTWSTVSTAVLPAGKELTFVQAVSDEPSREMFIALLLRQKHSIRITICYCSVLDECWVTDRGIARAHDTERSKDSCPFTAAERFTD